MTIAYLVDTDWVIHHLNGHPAITQRLQDFYREGLGLSVVALAELYEGVYYSRNPDQSERHLTEFLESVELIGLDEKTAKIFGRERGRLRQAGLLIGDMDLLIAATALQHHLTLLTNNRQHFERIEGLDIELMSLSGMVEIPRLQAKKSVYVSLCDVIPKEPIQKLT